MLPGRLAAGRIDIAALGRDFRNPALQKPALRLLAGERERPLERHLRLDGPTQTAAELGARRVRAAVVAEIAAVEDGVHAGEPRGRAVAHRNRDGAVELDDWRRIHPQKRVVQADDL